jgi:hyaluronate lyase
MALAYRTHGSSLQGNATLAADIVSALDFMDTSGRYNSTRTQPSGSGTSNWWHWQLGTPMALNDAVALMYSQLTASQITRFTAAVDNFIDSIGRAGANRAWEIQVVGVRAVLAKDSAKLGLARDGFSYLLAYRDVPGGEGFYTDGTHNQHYLAYNGGYGLATLDVMVNMVHLLAGSTWTITDPNLVNLYDFVYDAYQPLIWRGGFMDAFRGREISRHYAKDHLAGQQVARSILRLAESAPSPHSLAFKRMVKGWITADTYMNFFTEPSISIDTILLGQALMNNSAITPSPALVTYRQMPRGDRAVQTQSAYAFNVAFFSTRLLNYEAINSENGKAWYWGAGTTYIYNGDISQYSEDYWPTVDLYRMAGTTVVSQTKPNPTGNSSTMGLNPWAGGVSLGDLYGVSGFELDYPVQDKAAIPFNTLTARKSWFMFDDEIVAVGSGITSTDGAPIETIIENRRLSAAGSNAFVVNGTAQSTALGWSQTLPAVNWMHLTGNVSGSNIGYYLPVPTSVKALRQARTGDWQDLNQSPGTPTTAITRNYLAMWLDHGTNPTNASYSYVLLPNYTSAQTSTYATAPEITIVENSTSAHAVRENTLNILGVNFWTDTVKTVDILTSNKRASAILREVSGTLELSVSDPTQTNTGTITVQIARSATATVSVSPGVTVTQLSPTIILNVNVNGSKGRSFTATFSSSSAPIIVDNASPNAVAVGGWATASSEPEKYLTNYLHNSATNPGSKQVTFTPTLPTAGTYNVFAWWTDSWNRDTNVPIDVIHSGGTSTTYVNQTANGGVWYPIGTYTFSAGTTGAVRVRTTGTTAHVIADAVKFEKVP